jgi:hypothetical protein
LTRFHADAGITLLALFILLGMLGMLVATSLPADLSILGGLTILLVTGVLSVRPSPNSPTEAC